MSEQETILVVDDDKTNIDILLEALAADYELLAARRGDSALKIAKSKLPDLILLDVVMPSMDGYQVCRRLKQIPATAQIPVIFVTARKRIGDEEKGFQLGAVDYITKPFRMPIIKARIKNHLELKQAKEELKNQNQILEQQVQERTQKLERTQEVTIQSLATLAETRDDETGEHIFRTKKYIQVLTDELKGKPKFKQKLTASNIDWIIKSAPLHDIGKVGIPDKILNKPGPLTDEEFEIIKQHTVYGRNSIKAAEDKLGSNSFLRFARRIAHTHHEKWDGSGYPQGLVGEEIPVSGRLMAIVDVYDALASQRVYKSAYPHQRVVEIITEGDGRTEPDHFDPEVLEAFINVQDQFKKIAATFTDQTESGINI